jgi:hypothetical protein
MAGGFTAEDASRLALLLRLCGLALMAAGVLMVVATLLHPSRETAATIAAEVGRGARGLHGCLVAGAARPSGSVCGSPRRHEPARIGWLLDCFHGHVSDRSHRKLRFPRPSLGQALAGSARLD